MKKKISLLMAALMIVALFAACSSTPAASTAPSAAPSAAPKVTSITAATPALGVTANPWGATGAAENQIITNVFDGLTAVDKDGKIIPSLAEKWAISADGKTYTFTINKGVKFNDGTELKAADVKYSLDRAMTCVNKLKTNLASVNSVEVVDDYTVKINMKQIDVSILEKLNAPIGSKAAAEKYGDTYCSTPETTVTTGPYIITSFNPKVEVNYKANESYFKGAPSLKTVKVKAIADTNALTVALQTGDIQLIMNNVTGASLETLKADSKITIDSYPAVAEIFLFLNPNTGLTADARVRQAVAYAINRQDAFQVVTSGYGIIPDSPANWDFNGLPSKDKTWNYKQDIAKAKQLLQDAGAAGKSIKILVPASDIFVKLATVVQNQLAAVGLNVTIDQQDTNTMLANAKAGKFEIGIMQSSGPTRDAGDLLYLHFYSKNAFGGGNYSCYQNADMDALLTQMQTTVDSAARSKLIGQVIAKVTNEVVSEIPIAMADGYRAHTKTIKVEPFFCQYDKFYYYQPA